MTITILLADDHHLILDGLQIILNSEPDFEVIGQVMDGRTMVQEAVKLQPDVVVADVTMPELNGIEATRQLLDQYPECRVIILSMHNSSRMVMRALEIGASGYLLKGSASEEVVQAVRSVFRGQRYLSPKIARLVSEDLRAGPQTKQAEDPILRLSPREREVLQLVVEGHTNAKIAEKLHLSPKSIATYRSRIMEKLDMPDLPSLIKFAIRNGLTPWD